MNWKREKGESEKEYVMRICMNKESIGTWQDVADIINATLGRNHSESTYRKEWQRAERQIAEQIPIHPVYDTEKLDESSKEYTEAIMDRQKIQATKIELYRNLRQQSRFELFYENVRDAIQTLPTPTFEAIPAATTGKSYVLAISDLHYGSTFTSENNQYSRAECRRRMQVLLGEVIDFVVKEDVASLQVVSLGDLIQGIIHLTDLKLNDIPVVDCVVEVSRLLAWFLNELSAYCYVNYYAVSAANHTQTRPLGSKASELATEDVERIIVNYVADTLHDNPRISVHKDMSKDYIAFNVCGYDVLALHGHQIKNLNTAAKDLSALHQRFYDYIMVGHFHAGEELVVGERDGHNVEVLVCPSLIGSCPYSDKIQKGAKAAARIYGFDEAHGHIITRTFILN